MNYEDMSDHEINMAVTCIENNCQGWATTASNTGFYHCGVDGGGFYEVECVDYCNSPSDAWPIIVENKISISHSIALYRADALVYNSKFDNGFKIFKQDSQLGDTSSRGALRAAMICFLKMKDAESE